MMWLAPILGFFRIFSFELGLSLFIYIAQLAFYGYFGGYQLYVKVAAWNKYKDERAKQETSRDRLSFVMNDKGNRGNLLEDNDHQQQKSYQKRRDQQKIRKAYDQSVMPSVYALSNPHDGHNMKNVARPSKHPELSHGNNVVNNGIYIDTHDIRSKVESRVMHEVAHRVEDRVKRDLEE